MTTELISPGLLQASSRRRVLYGQARLAIHGPDVPACRTTEVVDTRDGRHPRSWLTSEDTQSGQLGSTIG
jgi:hypothetical protein